MSLKPLSYAHIIAIADAWRDIGGTPKVDIGAVEPLLWRDGQYRIHDVVRALTERNFKVSMTTNGQLLDVFSEKLSRAGISLIRISWHSTKPRIFQEISGGHGDYNRFIQGVTMALESGVEISFNRVLLKGYTDDIPEQLLFIERYKSRLKFYKLLWTEQGASAKDEFYQDWRPIVDKFVLPRTSKIVKVEKQLGRSRLQYQLIGGGMVEVKLGDNLDRSQHPCALRPFNGECREEFGDYVRVGPRLRLYFCYLRRDIGFQIDECFDNPGLLRQRIKETFGRTDIDIKNLLSMASLRLTVTPFCNFNCRAPGTQQGWCMEHSNGFIYPKMLPSLLRKE